MFMGEEFVWFTGVVEDRNDPLKLGRCKVRCLGWHPEAKDAVSTESLPWSHPIAPITSASMNGIGQTPIGPVEGTWVVGFFRDGKSAQEPVIMGTMGGIPSNTPDSTKGFNDPNGVYPTEINQPDTNKLARNDTNYPHDVLASKEADRDQNTSTGWSEPSSTYASTYPKNHVHESESGHIMEVDDTPNSERLHWYHKSGTFTEIDSSGTQVNRVRGDNYEILWQDNNVHIKGTCNLSIDGNCNTVVGGDYNLTVAGNMNVSVAQDSTQTTSGTATIIGATKLDLNP